MSKSDRWIIGLFMLGCGVWGLGVQVGAANRDRRIEDLEQYTSDLQLEVGGILDIIEINQLREAMEQEARVR